MVVKSSWLQGASTDTLKGNVIRYGPNRLVFSTVDAIHGSQKCFLSISRLS